MKKANLATVLVFIFFVFGLAIADMIHQPTEISLAERRPLAQFPQFSQRRVLDGRFSSDYATFLQDQVVFRDHFRAIKAIVELRLFQKVENNGVYFIKAFL